MKNPKNKILIVVTLAEVGGAQMSVLNLARELNRRGRDVTVAFGKGDFLHKECQRFNIPTKRFKHLNRSLCPFQNLLFILELRSFLRKNRFECVHINSSNALVGALSTFLMTKKPRVVFTYRGMSFLDKRHENSNLKRFFYTNLFRFLIKFVEKEVFVSKENLKSAKKLGLGKKGVVIYNGLDITELNFFTREKAREELEKLTITNLEKKLVIGSIGRLAYPKNYQFLIKNWPEIKEAIPEAVCVVIGDGRDRRWLERVVKEKGLEESFFFTGEYPNASKLMNGFDVFTLVSRYEGLSITTLEALFAGVPMLISKTGGNPEVVGNFEDSLFEVGADDEFKEKLKAIAKDEDLRERAYQMARKETYRFSISETANGYESVYREV